MVKMAYLPDHASRMVKVLTRTHNEWVFSQTTNLVFSNPKSDNRISSNSNKLLET